MEEKDTSDLKIGVIASGRGTNLQCIIDAVSAGRLRGVSIEVVISDRPGAEALQRAKRHGIDALLIEKKQYSTRDDFDAAMIRALTGHGVGLVVLAGFMRVLGPAFVDSFSERIINIHPALLPSFTGLDVHQRAIDAGVKFSGCTVHFVDKGLDTGPIIIQAVVPLLDDDTAETLASRILKEEHRVLPQAIDLFARHGLFVKDKRVFLREPLMADKKMAMENPPVTID